MWPTHVFRHTQLGVVRDAASAEPVAVLRRIRGHLRNLSSDAEQLAPGTVQSCAWTGSASEITQLSIPFEYRNLRARCKAWIKQSAASLASSDHSWCRELIEFIYVCCILISIFFFDHNMSIVFLQIDILALWPASDVVRQHRPSRCRNWNLDRGLP